MDAAMPLVSITGGAGGGGGKKPMGKGLSEGGGGGGGIGKRFLVDRVASR